MTTDLVDRAKNKTKSHLYFRPPARVHLAEPTGIKVLVCGGRDFHDIVKLRAELNKLHEERGFGLLIHGGAVGADQLAGQWAMERLIPVCVFPANWLNQGRGAGPIRNKAMITWGRPDLVVAFPGVVGTANMIDCAHLANIEVVDIER